MIAEKIVKAVQDAGGVLKLIDGKLKCSLPASAEYLVPGIKANKAEIETLLCRAGGRVANFPCCPDCHSYALYRLNASNDYKCLTCGLTGIKEVNARQKH